MAQSSILQSSMNRQSSFVNRQWARGYNCPGGPMTRRLFVLSLTLVVASLSLQAGAVPARAKTGMVISANGIASEVGWQVIKSGGNAVDGAVATAFALAVTHPTAGNIGGGGFLVYRAGNGQATSFDFREAAPAGANAEMWLTNGKYDFELHHNSH